MKAKLLPMYFTEANERERGEFSAQLERLQGFYGDVAEFLTPVAVGQPISEDADAIVFPQLIGAAFKQKAELMKIELPIVVLTSEFGTVEMWDWEIVTFLREEGGLNVFSPYNVELAKTIIRAIACKAGMKQGMRFLMFQDSPGEGMQANIFKRFYWWEEECTKAIEEAFGLKIIYKSWKELNEKAKAIPDDAAKKIWDEWDIPEEDVCTHSALSAVKIYIAVKEVIKELGGVEGVGCNCLNESMHSDTTPCLAWTQIFERDNILWVCEGDTVTLISKFIIYTSLKAPIMMTNIYPFLVGMAALKHERIDKFPDIEDPDNHALGVHCGYFGLAPKSFCTDWVMRPKALAIVDDNAIVIDCRFPTGPMTMAKIHPDMKKMTIIEAEIEDYVQYPGSDCRNGALIRYKNNNGHKVMESLSSHHALLIMGNCTPALLQMAKVFGFTTEVV